MSEQRPQTSSFDFRTAANLTAWLSHILSVPMNALLHHGLGERATGIPGLIAAGLLCLYAAVVGEDGHSILLFLGLYVGLCVLWKYYAIYRRRRLKQLVHTRYTGRPWLHHLVPTKDELAVKRVEALLVFASGALVSQYDRALGILLMAGGGGQAMSLAISDMIKHNKMLDQQDALIEQSQLAESSRDVLGR